MTARLTIADGQLEGWSLRIRADGRVEARSGARGVRWSLAPLRLLARHYPVDSAVWAWLREHGAGARPTPSGASVPASQRSTVAVQVRCTPELAARARDTARRRGLTLADVLEAGVATVEATR